MATGIQTRSDQMGNHFFNFYFSYLSKTVTLQITALISGMLSTYWTNFLQLGFRVPKMVLAYFLLLEFVELRLGVLVGRSFLLKYVISLMFWKHFEREKEIAHTRNN